MGKRILVLAAILIIALSLRLFKITSLPLYGDELTLVYDAYSILKTGTDSTGEAFPLTFKMGAGRPGGYIYASIPFVYLFGPTELGVRGLSVLSSLGIVILMYFLGKKLFNDKAGLISSLITSVSLWDIYLARGGFEAHFALFLALFGITMFLHEKYIMWGLLWGLTILTYPTFKLTLPIMFLILMWYRGAFTLFKNRLFITSVIVLSLFGLISFRETIMGRSEERFLNINVLSDKNTKEQIVQKINEERSLSSLSDRVDQIFFNKPIEYSRLLLENYVDNLSPRFLYLRGDGNPRHNPGEWGMLYLVELPLLFFGIYSIFRDKRKEGLLLTKWILIVPLASMFINNAHGLRNALMLPSLILISAYAFTKLPKKVSMAIAILMFTQLIIVLQRIYFLAPNKFAHFWSGEAKVASLDAIAKSKDGKKVTLLTKIDNIEYAYPVYAKIDPKLVINQYGKYPKVYGNVTISDK